MKKKHNLLTAKVVGIMTDSLPFFSSTTPSSTSIYKTAHSVALTNIVNLKRSYVEKWCLSMSLIMNTYTYVKSYLKKMRLADADNSFQLSFNLF